jgi:hypothetical protein
MAKKKQLPPPAPTELDKALSDCADKLDKLLSRVLASADAPARARARKAISATVGGGRWTDVSAQTGLTSHQLHAWLRWSPGFRLIWESARDAGEDVRRQRRVDVADMRAVDGWEEPVYHQGAQVGAVRRYDNRLLQWLIEADDPGKYRARDGGQTVNVQVNQLAAALAGSGPASLIRQDAPGRAGLVEASSGPATPEPPEEPASPGGA